MAEGMITEAEESNKKLTTKDKAKKLAALGISEAEKFLKGKEERQSNKLAAVTALAEDELPVTGQREFSSVALGAPPTIGELGVSGNSASNLLSGKHLKIPSALSGTDVSSAEQENLGALLSEIQPDRGVGAGPQRRLEDRKRRVVLGSISRRNPEVFSKGGPAGTDDFSSFLTRQIERQNRGR